MENELGFGFFRLPRLGDDFDYPQIENMVDLFLAKGGRYFDTAYNYVNGKCEEALGKTLVARYPRDSFQIATKLPGYNVTTREDCWAHFETSCRRVGVDYFDVYMLHWMNQEHYRHAQEYRQFDFLQELKAAGKAKQIGFSFHDTPQLLDQILTEHPEVDAVLIQINYLDWESPGIQSRLCMETAIKHGKRVIVMEPVKGGVLANIPENASQVLQKIDPNASPASLALRFVRGLPGIDIVLSGMSTLQQMEDNLAATQPLSQEQAELLFEAGHRIRSSTGTGCSGCGYCLSHCPMEIPISQCFALYNEYALYPRHLWKLTPAYQALPGGKASQCIGCQSCEANCPQQLPISQLMETVRKAFEQ